MGPVEFFFSDNYWLSRNISQAPVKQVPIYNPFACWYYGNSNLKYWSNETWKVASETLDRGTELQSEQYARMNDYLNNRVGVDTENLLGQSRSTVSPVLNCGELGFSAPYCQWESSIAQT